MVEAATALTETKRQPHWRTITAMVCLTSISISHYRRRRTRLPMSFLCRDPS